VLLSVGSASVRVRNVMSGQETELEADRVVAVGERQARDWGHLVPDGLQVSVIGDAVVPRRVHHAISEGRAAARELAQLAGR
jgi:2,4-dienoyl-CoA reductase (NADPH2)